MRLRYAVLFLACVLATPLMAANPAPPDTWLWLEDVSGKQALDWVTARNVESTGELAGSEEFKALNARFLEITDSNARIPYLSKIGDHYYNFWRDKEHVRGIWRRTSLAEYRKSEPKWETVLDLDALAKAENENWVWHGASALPPAYTRCLVELSRGGADADVVREFDLATMAFVKDGFVLPESKSGVGWIDADRLYLAEAIDSSTMTTSGYARVVKEWKRGTPYSSATVVYEGKTDDVSVSAYHDFTPGFERDFVYRAVTFYSNEEFLRQGDKLIKIEKPDDAEVSVHREWLLIQLRTEWKAGGRTWPAGALLATNFEGFLAGKRQFEMLFIPTERKSLAGYTTTQSNIILNELDNVKNRLYVLRPEKGTWTRTGLPGLPEFGAISASAVDKLTSDDYFVTLNDFLTPTSYSHGTVGGGPPEKLKQLPTFFDAANLVVTQHEAISKDGTAIPYFQVAPKGLSNDGSAATLLTGYGGFEVSSLPSYSGVRGTGWLEKGGVYVLANIRGGGEFGPKWHEAGVKAQRYHCYEDFIAVAEDLVKRKVTTPQRLACMGGSNGGLLVGNMLTMRPDLFGAVVCQQPLLDMRRYHKLLAGASWMGEYGNPDDPEEWKFMQDWSPYQAVKKDAKYPRILFTTSMRDNRVHPGHARKMAAAMKEYGHDVVFYENVEGGHSGAANNKQQAFMSALAYTFLWKQLSPAAGATVREMPK